MSAPAGWRGWWAVRRRLARALPAGLLAALALGAGACRPTQGPDPQTAQNVAELGDAVSALEEQSAQLQAQVDALRAQVARQDTLLRQIARLAGLSPGP